MILPSFPEIPPHLLRGARAAQQVCHNDFIRIETMV